MTDGGGENLWAAWNRGAAWLKVRVVTKRRRTVYRSDFDACLRINVIDPWMRYNFVLTTSTTTTYCNILTSTYTSSMIDLRGLLSNG